MIIAKLSIKYERGLKRNRETDLGLEKFEKERENGKLIAGLGMHYVSADMRVMVKERDKNAAEIREAFNNRFIRAPLEGCYIISESGEAKAFIEDLSIRMDVKVTATEYTLSPNQELEEDELVEWSARVKNQLAAVSLGRKKEADEQGLSALKTLARCPLVSKATGDRIMEMVELLESDRISRVELKRGIDELDVTIEPGAVLSPRRAPMQA